MFIHISRNTTFQKGRSMLEMLAILVVISIIATALLAGFTYAMNKNRANTIAKDVVLRAAAISTDPAFSNYHLNSTIGALGFKTQVGNLTYTQTKIATTRFAIDVTPVSESICRRLSEGKFASAVSVSVNDNLIEPGNVSFCSENGNKITFVYDAVIHGMKQDTYECGVCYKKSGDDCVYACEGAQICTDSGCECPSGTPTGADPISCQCSGDLVPNSSNICACPSNQVSAGGDQCECPEPITQWDGGKCVCPSGTPTGADPETCQCYGNKIVNSSNTCVCESNKTDPDGDNVCTCPDPITHWNGSACVCPNGQTLSNGHCCPSPTTYWNGSACVCPSGTPVGADPSTCQCYAGQTLSNDHCCSSPTTYWNGSACVCPDNKILTNGVCCSSGQVGSNGHCCPSPTTYWNGSACVCPNGQTLSNGHCCPSPTTYWNGSACVCPNGQTLSNGHCCPSPTTYWNGSACICPSGTPGGADPSTCQCYAGQTLSNGHCCSSPKTYWNGSACVCPSGTPVGANPSTCQCYAGQTLSNGHCCTAPKTYWNGSACVCPSGTPAGADQNTCKCPTGSNLNTATNTCITCTAPKTQWNAATNQCVCPPGSPTGHDANTCQCPAGQINMNGTCGTCPAPKTYWNGSACVCPSGTPVGADQNTCQCPAGQVNMNGTCGTCPAPTTVWNGSACVCPSGTYLTTMSDGTRACLPYCQETNTGLFLLVDRSGSTTGSRLERINQSLNSLKFPLQGNMALYHHSTGGCNDKYATSFLPYGPHTQSELNLWFNSGAEIQPHCESLGTYFHWALQDINNRFCQNGEKIIIAWWTDAELKNGTEMQKALSEMKTKCDVRLFFISTSDKDRSYITNALDPSQYQFFTFEDTTNIQAAINSAIQDQQCIRRETSFNPYSDESYFCNRLSALTPTHLRNMTEAQCNICQTTFREGDSTDSVKPCWSCNFGSPKNTTQAQCFKCPNRFWRSSNTTCYSCSAGDVGGTTEAECLRCSNRFWRGTLTTSATNCFNCSRTESVSKTTREECYQCPDRFWRSSNTTCYSCNSGDVSGTTKEECLRCSNRFWRGTLTTSTINCFNCDRSDSVTNTTREECHQCPNRFWGGADLNKNTNRCYICTAGSVSNVRQEDCLRCPNRVWTYKSTDASGIQLGTCAKQ